VNTDVYFGVFAISINGLLCIGILSFNIAAGDATIALVIYSGAGFFVRVELGKFDSGNPDLPIAALAVKKVRYSRRVILLTVVVMWPDRLDQRGETVFE